MALLELLHNSKKVSCFSHRWNVSTNPDLPFASVGYDNRLPDRRVLGNFPRSQHRSSLATPSGLKNASYSNLVKRWNFRKAESLLPSWWLIRWNFAISGNKHREGIPETMREPVVCGYTVHPAPSPGRLWCPAPRLLHTSNILFKNVAPLWFLSPLLRNPGDGPEYIPRGRRKNYLQCWDKKCETLYRSFFRVPVGTDSDRAASSILLRLDQKRQERWEQAVDSIDF